MDQVKDFLRQCVKYRFWIAFGISLLLPMIGYFVAAGSIQAETKKNEDLIKGADTKIKKYTSPGIVNQQYQPLAAAKKEALVKDVDATWRKVYALQEPLLKWPEVVEERFRTWGRKYPSNTDPSTVRSVLTDYAIAYPEFVNKLYAIVQPFNFEDGKGIVVVPPREALLRPAPFSTDNPPELGKVWAEQERIWVVTALLDVVARLNAGVGAKDWEGAMIKQILALEVGSPTDQDQRSMAKGEALVPSDPLLPEGVAAPVAATPAGGVPGMPGGPMMGGPSQAQANEVFYNKTDPSAQYKLLPIRLSVLVEQSRIPDFLVGLENSPMAIQVLEFELAKPLTPLAKPTVGGQAYASSTGGPGYGPMGGGGDMALGGPRGPGGGPMMGIGGKGMEGREGGPMMGPMMGIGGRPAGKSAGTSNRGVERKNRKDSDDEKKEEGKAKIDQYYNVVELTVYGQARFYLAPPPPPTPPPASVSESANPTPAPAAPAANPAAPTPSPTPAPGPGGAPAPAEAPKPEANPQAPAADAPKPEAAPGDMPKAEAPKTDAPKTDAPKSDSPKP